MDSLTILYIARHGSGGNDDEGAITYALEQLGHKVRRFSELEGKLAVKEPADFVLVHNYHDVRLLDHFKIPKVLWYFDLVDYPDPTLAGRCARRKAWITDIMSRVDLGFLTDGDWVAEDRTGKLVQLSQGADERYLATDCSLTNSGILFTGIGRGGGRGRESFVENLSAYYGGVFQHVSKGVHGKELRDLIRLKAIVVAPYSPVTDRYWSNRVYLTLGFGGFLLHPYCYRLTADYEDGKEIVYYHDWVDLKDKIGHYLTRGLERHSIATAGLEKTRKCHTYRARVEKLIETVKARLL